MGIVVNCFWSATQGSPTVWPWVTDVRCEDPPALCAELAAYKVGEPIFANQKLMMCSLHWNSKTRLAPSKDSKQIYV